MPPTAQAYRLLDMTEERPSPSHGDDAGAAHLEEGWRAVLTGKGDGPVLTSVRAPVVRAGMDRTLENLRKMAAR